MRILPSQCQNATAKPCKAEIKVTCATRRSRAGSRWMKTTTVKSQNFTRTAYVTCLMNGCAFPCTTYRPYRRRIIYARQVLARIVSKMTAVCGNPFSLSKRRNRFYPFGLPAFARDGHGLSRDLRHTRHVARFVIHCVYIIEHIKHASLVAVVSLGMVSTGLD
ncbi:hypothetical protein BIW11_10654, partial [Tropilaelaps mercedesae]